MKILIMGLPGSGKTTQSKILANSLNLCFIKTGEILRELSKQDGEVAKGLKEAMEKGELVDNKVAADVVRDRVLEMDCQNGFIMDGYPRSLDQLQYFDPKFDKVFYLKISPEQSEKRLLQRGRQDDSPEIIDKRIRVQNEKLNPLLDYFSNNSDLIEIDGEQDIEKVAADIRGSLNET